MNTRLKYVPEVSNAAIEVVASEAQDIAHVAADFRQARGHRKESLKTILTQRIDELLFVMLNAFSGTVEKEEAAVLLSEHHPLTETRLGKLPANAVPFVVLRELISVHQVPIDRPHLTNWPSFAQRYQFSI